MQNQSSAKIGLGLITCDRVEFFKQSYASVKDIKDIELVVIDDGYRTNVDFLIDQETNPHVNFIKTTGKEGVGAAKNHALGFLLEEGCTDIFLMEDDIQVLDSSVFDLYITTSKATGIKHFNFGLHGNHNRDFTGTPTPRKIVNYPDGSKVILWPNVLGAFSYYHLDALAHVGLMDEQFYNALEHVDHTYQIIKAGYHPHFRWFADVVGAESMLQDIVPDHQQSKIRSEEDFVKNFLENHDRFVEKNKFAVVAGRGPAENNYTEEEVLESLKEIWKKYHQ